MIYVFNFLSFHKMIFTTTNKVCEITELLLYKLQIKMFFTSIFFAFLDLVHKLRHFK